MVNPADGLLGEAEFLPSIAEVKKWLDARSPAQQPTNLAEHKLLPHIPEPEWTPEEREKRAAQADRAKAIANQIREATRRMTVGRKMDVSCLSLEERKRIADYVADPHTV